MRVIAPLLLCLLSALVEVHSLTPPYLTFKGNNIPNHSYVDLKTVGREGPNSVQCHTDLSTCCSRIQGRDRGDWYFPNKNKLRFSSGGVVFMARTTQRVDLRYLRAGGPSGIYRCDIETTAVNDKDGLETVYVGLYSRGGTFSKLVIPYNVFFMQNDIYATMRQKRFTQTITCEDNLFYAVYKPESIYFEISTCEPDRQWRRYFRAFSPFSSQFRAYSILRRLCMWDYNQMRLCNSYGITVFYVELYL